MAGAAGSRVRCSVGLPRGLHGTGKGSDMLGLCRFRRSSATPILRRVVRQADHTRRLWSGSAAVRDAERIAPLGAGSPGGGGKVAGSCGVAFLDAHPCRDHSFGEGWVFAKGSDSSTNMPMRPAWLKPVPVRLVARAPDKIGGMAGIGGQSTTSVARGKTALVCATRRRWVW